MRTDSSGKIITAADEWRNGATKVSVSAHQESVGFGAPVETFFGIERANIRDFDLEVIAVDVDGERHSAFGHPILHADQWGYGFGVTLSRVKEFRILARSVQTDFDWFRFENVSLQEGVRMQPQATLEQYVDQGPLSQHLRFTPRAGIANDTNWTALVKSGLPGDEDSDRLMAHVAIEGEFPVTREGDNKPLFTVKLLAGDDDSLSVRLVTPNGVSHDRTLSRGKPIEWKHSGHVYRLLYPESKVALDQPAETPLATIVVSRQTPAGDGRNGRQDHGSSR